MAQANEIATQKEFAQNGIRWKMDDAKAAGIHPLAALGAPTASGGGTMITSQPDTSVSQGLQNMGQSVSRAIQSQRTAQERQLADLQLANAQADLDGKLIENQIKSSSYQKMNQVGPAFPSAMDGAMIPGQGNSVIPGFKVTPSEASASSRFNSGVQAGGINSLQYTREADGSIGIAPSKDAKERNEDDFIAESLWHIKNRFMPPPPDPREWPLPKGFTKWQWNPFTQSFKPGHFDTRNLHDDFMKHDFMERR